MLVNHNQNPSVQWGLFIWSGLALLGLSPLAKADFALKANDRVVFYGDSITEQRLYTTMVETFCTTRFPKLPLTFVHSGWGGDGVRGGGGGYNAVLQRYGAFVNETGIANSATVSDFNTPVVAMLQKANALDAPTAHKLIGDRIHPGPGGHLIMAEALLKSWGAPAVVSDVAIDVTAKQVSRTQNTQISNLEVGDKVSWTQADNALPFPLDSADNRVALVLKSSDFVAALDQQPLQVIGLSAPRYTLTIDGKEVGNFTREELAVGVNLALLPTPMLDQTRDVQKLTLKHNEQHFERWRFIQVPMEKHNEASQKAALPLLKALDNEEGQTIADQRAAAQAKPYDFVLSAVNPA